MIVSRYASLSKRTTNYRYNYFPEIGKCMPFIKDFSCIFTVNFLSEWHNLKFS